MNARVAAVVAGCLVFGSSTAWAAKAPVGPEGLKQEAEHIVSGRVVEVTSSTRKSKVETAWGIHRDRVFRITLKVETVRQGSGIRAGAEIQVVAWQPARRIPPLPGLQGHHPIPRKGDAVTVYLKGKDGEAFKPILPNGMVIEPPTE